MAILKCRASLLLSGLRYSDSGYFARIRDLLAGQVFWLIPSTLRDVGGPQLRETVAIARNRVGSFLYRA